MTPEELARVLRAGADSAASGATRHPAVVIANALDAMAAEAAAIAEERDPATTGEDALPVTVEHVGMREHDGWVTHSHEFAPDHAGVPRRHDAIRELCTEHPGLRSCCGTRQLAPHGADCRASKASQDAMADHERMFSHVGEVSPRFWQEGGGKP